MACTTTAIEAMASNDGAGEAPRTRAKAAANVAAAALPMASVAPPITQPASASAASSHTQAPTTAARFGEWAKGRAVSDASVVNATSVTSEIAKSSVHSPSVRAKSGL